MSATISKILQKAGVILGVVTMLLGYFGDIIGVHASPFTLIAVGNVVLLASVSLTFREQRRRVGELENHLAPRFKILFDGGGTFQRLESQGPDVSRRTFCIGVENVSGTTIDDVRVELERYIDYKGSKTIECAIALRQTDDNPGEDALHQQTFILHPHQIKYVDVVSWLEGTRVSKDQRIVLCYAVKGVSNSIPGRGHELHVKVTGRNVAAQHREFLVDVSDDGRLGFEIKPPPAETNIG